MYAAAGHFHDLRNRVAVRCIHDIGGAEGFGHLKLAGHRIDRNNPARTGQCRTVNTRQPNPATTNHRNGCARFNCGRVKHTANAGRYGTTYERRAIHRHVLTDFDDGMFMHQHLLSK